MISAQGLVRWGALSMLCLTSSVVVIAVVAGCSSPPAAPASANVPAAASTPSVGSLGDQRQAVKDFQVCELLSSKDRSTLGITSIGSPGSVDGHQVCDWTIPNSFGITVTMQAGVASLPSSSAGPASQNPKTFAIGSHQARELPDQRSTGLCAVVLTGTAEKSTVQTVHIDVSNTNFRDSALACRRATTVANLIEPKLS